MRAFANASFQRHIFLVLALVLTNVHSVIPERPRRLEFTANVLSAASSANQQVSDAFSPFGHRHSAPKESQAKREVAVTVSGKHGNAHRLSKGKQVHLSTSGDSSSLTQEASATPAVSAAAVSGASVATEAVPQTIVAAKPTQVAGSVAPPVATKVAVVSPHLPQAPQAAGLLSDSSSTRKYPLPTGAAKLDQVHSTTEIRQVPMAAGAAGMPVYPGQAPLAAAPNQAAYAAPIVQATPGGVPQAAMGIPASASQQQQAMMMPPAAAGGAVLPGTVPPSYPQGQMPAVAGAAPYYVPQQPATPPGGAAPLAAPNVAAGQPMAVPLPGAAAAQPKAPAGAKKNAKKGAGDGKGKKDAAAKKKAGGEEDATTTAGDEASTTTGEGEDAGSTTSAGSSTTAAEEDGHGAEEGASTTAAAEDGHGGGKKDALGSAEAELAHEADWFAHFMEHEAENVVMAVGFAICAAGVAAYFLMPRSMMNNSTRRR